MFSGNSIRRHERLCASKFMDGGEVEKKTAKTKSMSGRVRKMTGKAAAYQIRQRQKFTHVQAAPSPTALPSPSKIKAHNGDEWLGEATKRRVDVTGIDAKWKSTSRRSDSGNPARVRVLDHVIVSRAVFGNEEGVDDVDGTAAPTPITGSPSLSPAHQKNNNSAKGQPKNYVAQIEALYEDGATGLRYVRLAWYFWPIETCFSIEELKPLPGEIFTSSEVDVCPLTSIRRKVSIVPFSKRMPELHLSSTDAKDAERDAGPSSSHAALFARRHYHHRAEVMIEPQTHIFSADDALTPWLATFLLQIDAPDFRPHARSRHPDARHQMPAITTQYRGQQMRLQTSETSTSSQWTV